MLFSKLSFHVILIHFQVVYANEKKHQTSYVNGSFVVDRWMMSQNTVDLMRVENLRTTYDKMFYFLLFSIFKSSKVLQNCFTVKSHLVLKVD